MKAHFKNRKLHLESLEERTLLAVTTGGIEQAAELAAPLDAVGDDGVVSIDVGENQSDLGFEASVGDTGEGALPTGAGIDGTYTVKNGDSEGGGSLRWGLNNAKEEGITEIIVPYDIVKEIVLNAKDGEIEIDPAKLVNKKITIKSSGFETGKNVTISGNDAVLVFRIKSGATVTIQGVDVINGRNKSTKDPTNDGGGISNSGKLTLVNCRVTKCETDTGEAGGIYNLGELTMVNCLVSDNHTTRRGGGICNSTGPNLNPTGGHLIMYNCTVAGNIADEDGGGIFNHNNSTIELYNCIVVKNSTNDISKSKDGLPGSIKGFRTLSTYDDWDSGSGRNTEYENQKIFSDTDALKYTPRMNSVTIDAGNYSKYNNLSNTDLAGSPRLSGAEIDLGCYEYKKDITDVSLTGWTGIYDGQAHSITVNGLRSTDTVEYTYAGTTSGTMPTFINAGTYTVSVTVSRDGYDSWTGDAKVIIGKKQLTVSKTTVKSKTYDGRNIAEITVGNVEGIVGKDSVTVSASGAFPSRNVGTYEVPVSYSVTGSASNNYIAPATEKISATISKRGLTVTGTTASDKVYDGTTDAAVSGGTLVGVLGDDDVKIASMKGTFDDENVGTGKTVTVTYTLGGADAGNYTVADATTTASITQKGLTVTGTKASNKVYDGTTNATVSGGTLTGFDDGDDVQIVSAVGTFDNKNVGTNKTVTVTYTLGGKDAGKYKVNDTTTTANITPKGLTVTGTTASDKVYDGTADAAVSGGTLVGVLGDDDVSIASMKGTFGDKNVGLGKTVTVTYTLGGADAGNYTVADATAAADIAKKQLRVADTTILDKVYDGTTDATVAGVTIGGVITGDVVSIVSMKGTFENKDVGMGKSVMVTYTLGGPDGGNYSVADSIATGNILPKQLTVAGATASDKVYDGTTDAEVSGGTLVGVVDGDVVSIASMKGTFDDKNVGTDKTVTVTYTLGGADVGNYTAADATTTANITPKQLTVTGTTASDKAYDGTTSATVSGGTLVGVLGNDDVSIASMKGTFDDENVGTDKTVTVTYTLGGADAGNYTASDATTTASIFKKQLTVTGTTASNKVYDGTTDAAVSGGTLVGVLGDDDVKIASMKGAFNSKNAGPNRTVKVTYTLGGADAGNYSVADATTKAHIFKKLLGIAGTTVSDKAYDATTNAQITAGTLQGVVGQDNVTVTASGAFPSADVGTYKVPVCYAIAGKDANNYIAPVMQIVCAAITPAAFDVTFKDRTVQYDGAAHSIPISVNQSLVTPTVLYSQDGENYTSAVPSFTEIGSYTVYAKVTGPNYDDWTGSATLTITPFDPLLVTTELDVVDSTDGLTSLREAVSIAETGQTVRFADYLAGETITLRCAQIDIPKGINIDATSIGGITVDAAGKSRIFFIPDNGGAEVKIIGLTLTGGNDDNGGAIKNSGTLSLFNCSVTGNMSTHYGGGIFSTGDLTIVDSVISANSADSYVAGGIYTSGDLTMIGSTVSGNTAKNGGGIYVSCGLTKLTNTIVSFNNACSNPDIRGTYFAARSIVSADPGFVVAPTFAPCGRLANGDEIDLSLSYRSIAINTGTNDAVVNEFDVVWNPRVIGEIVDIGAYEFQKAPEAPSTVVTTTLDVANPFDGLISLREAISYAERGGTVTFDDSLAGGTITLDGTELQVGRGIKIDASSIGGITIDADGLSRVFYVDFDIQTPDDAGAITDYVPSTNPCGGSSAASAPSCVGSDAPIETKISVSYEVPTATQIDEVTSLSEVSVGATIYVSIYAKSTDPNYGILGGYCSLYYDSDAFTRGEYISGSLYPVDTVNDEEYGDYDYSTDGYFSVFGGFPSQITNAYGNSQWALVGTQAFTVNAMGEYSFRNGMAKNGNGEERLTWNLIREDYPETLNQEVDFDSVTLTVNGGRVSLIGLTITGGNAEFGGGICNVGDLSLINCVVKGNNALEYGGGIANSGALTITNSTISGNAAAKSGGGIFSDADRDFVSITNTIAALNYAETSANIDGSFICNHNIIGTDPGFIAAPVFEDGHLINELSLNLSLAKGSAAINAGTNDAVKTATDIAGNPRIIDGIVDIGAYEYDPAAGFVTLDAPVILSGNKGVYISYGANRHYLQWTQVANASGYEVQYSTDGKSWTCVNSIGTGVVIDGLAYGADVTYRVRALGADVYLDSEWSGAKTFNVCPMDINNDGEISIADLTILRKLWLSTEGDGLFQYYADIDGDGAISVADRSYLSRNWLHDAGDDDLVYPHVIPVPATVITNVVLKGWSGQFDGESHTVTLIDPDLATDTVVYTYNGVQYNEAPSFTEVGAYDVYATVSREGYDDWTGCGTITIKANTITDVKLFGWKGYVDGEAHSITLIDPELATDAVVYVYGGAQHTEAPSFTEIGIYPVMVVVSREGCSDWIGCTTVTIMPKKSITDVTLEGWEGYYDGQCHTVTLTGTLETDKVFYTYNGQTYQTAPKFTKAGIYTVSATVSRDGYNDWTGSATVTIKPQQCITNVTLEGWIGVYDGKPHTVTLTDPDAATDTIVYSYGGNTYNTPPEFSEIGTYPVSVTVSRPGYIDWTGTAPVIIAARPDITGVSLEGWEGNYDGKTHTVTLTGALATDKVVYTYNGQTYNAAPKFTKVGTYNVSATVSRDGYNDWTGSATVTIKAKDIKNVTLTGWDGIYDGKTHTVTLNGALSSDTVVYTFNGVQYNKAPTFTEVGTYTVSATVTREGYNDWTGSAKVTIKPVAAGLVVTTNRDIVDAYDGLLSLREAISYIESGSATGSRITFSKNVFTGGDANVITLTRGELTIGRSMTIDASSLTEGVVIDADGKSRVFYVYGGNETSPVELIGLTITGGTIEGLGGGIYNCNGTLTVTNSVISGNTSKVGGGIYNCGELVILNSTISGNAAKSGGGVYNTEVGNVRLVNTIVTFNYAEDGVNIVGRITGSYNIIGNDPKFAVAPVFVDGELINADTLNLALTAESSRAINCGRNDAVLTETDIAGNPRIVGGVVDIGAYEFRAEKVITLDVPKNLSASAVATDAIAVSWNAVENASGYEMAWKLAGSSQWQTQKTANLSLTLDGLATGDVIQLKVRALGDGIFYNDSDFSATVDFNLVAERLATPTDFGILRLDDTSVTLLWGSSPNASGYEVAWKADSWTEWETEKSPTLGKYLVNFESLSICENVSFKVRALGDGNHYVDSEYTETVEAFIDMIRTPITGLSFKDQTYVYVDNVSRSLTLVGARGTDTVTYKYKGDEFDSCPKFTDAGEYAVTVKVSREGYKDWYATAVLTIKKATLTGVTFANQTCTYDGNGHSLNVAGLRSGDTVVYEYNGKTSGACPEFTDAGVYEVFVRVSRKNFKDWSGSAKLTIREGTITDLSFTNQTIAFDGKPHSFAVDGLLPTDKVKYRFNGEDYNKPLTFTKKGTYTVTATVSRANYKVWTETARLTITDAQHAADAVFAEYDSAEIGAGTDPF